jgi:hypothetical protein
MTDPVDIPLSGETPSDTDSEIDADGDADDPVDGTADLPGDVANDDLDDPDDPMVDAALLEDTDVDAPVVGLEDEDDHG